MQQLLKNPDSWSDSSSLCSGSEKSKASTRLTYSSGTSYCKNADVKGKKTSGGSKRVSEVGNAHANTLTAYEIQKNQEKWQGWPAGNGRNTPRIHHQTEKESYERRHIHEALSMLSSKI